MSGKFSLVDNVSQKIMAWCNMSCIVVHLRLYLIVLNEINTSLNYPNWLD